MLYKSKILFISPHTDDVELGAGATLIKFMEEKLNVFVASFCSAKESLEQHGKDPNLLKTEFENSMKCIGLKTQNYFLYDFPLRNFSYVRQKILDQLIWLKNELNPDLVIIPSINDLHQDHQVINSESIRAFKDRSIWCYELPWNQMNFKGSCYVKLDKRLIDKKIEVLRQYKSQIELGRPYFQEDFVLSLARVRGCQGFTQYAEAFEVIREYVL